MEQTLILYSGPHCPLCEQAKALLYPLLQGAGWRLQEVDISADSNLKTLYGNRIPVIVTPGGQEKAWPFTAGQVQRLIKPPGSPLTV